MNKTLQNLLFMIIFTGCSKHIGYITGSNCKKNCYITRIAIGRVEVKSFLGLKTKPYESLFFTAKSNMERVFPLQKDEFYDNYVIDYLTVYSFFYKKSAVTIRANIVTEDYTSTNHTYCENYQQTILQHKPTQIDYISLSDSVVYLKRKELKKGIIIDFVKNKALIMHTNNKGDFIFRKIPIRKLYCIDNEILEELTNREVGQVLSITSDSHNSIIVKKIIGIRKNKMLISVTKNNRQSYQVVSLNDMIEE